MHHPPHGIDQAPLFFAGDSRRPKRYFPFAEGPRSCVGQSLAKVSLVATMATLLSRFSFKLAEEVGLGHFPAVLCALWFFQLQVMLGIDGDIGQKRAC